MALQKTFQTRMCVSGNYINFDICFMTKTSIQLRMNYWKDQETRNIENALPMNDQMSDVGTTRNRITDFACIYVFEYNLDSTDNVYKQAYAYLTTLPEFSGAASV